MSDDDLLVRHAEHFLSRLDRLNTRQIDLALGLYRDPGLLRSVLQQVSLPDAAERVAVSLGDPSRGPFIVVTRDGHFVTCLAEGMSVGEHPIVSRGQLDALAQKVNTLRERMAEAERLTGGSDRACGQLLRRLLVRADGVSREEFLAVSAWEPLLAPVFMDLYLAMSGELPFIAPQLRRLKTTKGRAGEALHSYWNRVHAASHLALLATMGGEQEHYQTITEDSPAARAALAHPLTNTGVTRFILIGAWSAGRLGKQLLPAYKRALGEDVAFFELLDTIFALVAIGRRTSRLRAEIAKALHAAPSTARNPHAERVREVMGDAVTTVCGAAVEMLNTADAELDEWVTNLGLKLLQEEGSPTLPDVPREIARATAFSLYADGLTNGQKTSRSLALIAAAVRGPPEQFYFPREFLQIVHTPWEPAHTELLLAPHRKVEQAYNQPIRREKQPSPNDPCPCGSGKKYKKCCRP
jgi:hypothetical protein